MRRVTGVWLDFDKAFVYHLQKGKNEFEIIESQMEHFHPKGGSGGSTPYGAQDAISERALLERKKHQIKEYFKRIMEHLDGSLEVLIMGPAEAKIGLTTELGELNSRTFKLHKMLTVDNMTENQLKATIRDFYKNRKG